MVYASKRHKELRLTYHGTVIAYISWDHSVAIADMAHTLLGSIPWLLDD